MYVAGAPYSARGFELPSAYAPKGSGFLTQMERTQAAVFLNSEQNGAGSWLRNTIRTAPQNIATSHQSATRHPPAKKLWSS